MDVTRCLRLLLLYIGAIVLPPYTRVMIGLRLSHTLIIVFINALRYYYLPPKHNSVINNKSLNLYRPQQLSQ